MRATGGLDAAKKVFADPLLGPGGWGAINLETNCGDHTFARALTEAQELLLFFGYNEAPDRLLGRAASFCMERAGYNSGGWNDQGLIFFLPNMTWFQPPAFVHRMINDAWRPHALAVNRSTPALPCGEYYAGYTPGPCVSVASQASDDGLSITVQLLNVQPFSTTIHLSFRGETSLVSSLVNASWLQSNNTAAVNTPARPEGVLPSWRLLDVSKPIHLPRNCFAVFEAAVKRAAR